MPTYSEMSDEVSRLKAIHKIDMVRINRLKVKAEQFEAIELTVINAVHRLASESTDPPEEVPIPFAVYTAVGMYRLQAKLEPMTALKYGEPTKVSKKINVDGRSEEGRAKKRPKGGGRLGMGKARSSSRKDKGVG